MHVFLPPDSLSAVENSGLGNLVVAAGFKSNTSAAAGQQAGQRCSRGQAAAFSVANRGLGRLLVMGLDSPSVDVRSSGWAAGRAAASRCCSWGRRLWAGGGGSGRKLPPPARLCLRAGRARCT